MPKFKKTTVTRTNQAGESQSYMLNVHISDEGRFYVLFDTKDDELELFPALQWTQPQSESIDADINQPRSNARHRIETSTYDGLTAWFAAAIDRILSVNVTTERVIVYFHQTRFAAWQEPDGTLRCNGGDSEYDYEKGGRWVDGSETVHATQRARGFTMGVVARVFDKHIYSGNGFEKTKYEKPKWDHLHHEYPTFAAKLNGFTSELPFEPTYHDQMPYTEEAARFFYDLMISIAAAGLRFNAFMNDKEGLQRHIENGGTGLPRLLSSLDSSKALEGQEVEHEHS